MSEDTRWSRLHGRRVSRRALLAAAGSAGVGLAGLGLVGCGDDDDDDDEQAAPEAVPEVVAQAQGEPVRGGILREGYDRGSERMDPIAALWWDAASFPAVHETLFALDADGVNQPLLAESWEVTDDGLTWNFKIREGLQFHTGRPINAESVAASLNWTNNPEGVASSSCSGSRSRASSRRGPTTSSSR